MTFSACFACKVTLEQGLQPHETDQQGFQTWRLEAFRACSTHNDKLLFATPSRLELCTGLQIQRTADEGKERENEMMHKLDGLEDKAL